MLEFLSLMQQLKTTKRTGWLNSNISNPESISDHMYRMSIIALTIPDPTNTLDRNKMVKMALVHDMAEAIVGDITPFDGISSATKHDLEEQAMGQIMALLKYSPQALEIKELFDEYEQASTPEAILVKDLDKYEMIVQAFEYEKSNATTESLETFFTSTRGKFKHPVVIEWVKELYDARMKFQSA